MPLRGHARLVVLAALVPLAHCTPPSRRNGPQPETPAPPPQPTPVYVATPPPALPPPAITAQPEPQRPRPIFHFPPPRPSATASAPPPVTPSTTPPAAAGCGSVDVDGVAVPFDCWTKDYAKLDVASKAAMRQAFAAASTTALPDYVDHRRDKLEGPTRHQLHVGAGAAFALASAIDQALLRAGVAGAAVSVAQLWGRAPRSSFGAIVSASVGRTIAAEAVLPYDEATACTWATGDAARLCKSPEKHAPRADELLKAEQTPLARLADIVEIDGTNGEQLRDTLAKNQDVLAVLRVDADAWKSVIKSQDTEPLIPDYVGAASVHAITVVGYAKQDTQWFFLLKNSWGSSWGAGGYAWISESSLKKNVIEAYVVQAQPANAATPTAPPPPTACADGQVPDAVTKACAPACPDKSPRTSGVCPDPKQSGCAPGFVNVTGHCVVAAPDKQGSDPGTGLVYACGAAGCTYGWKKGTLGCLQAQCSLSCPAPKFLAAVNVAKKTVSCTE